MTIPPTAASKKFPVHPPYQDICDLNKQYTEQVFKKLEGATTEERYQTYLKIRAASDAAASKLVVPQTLRSEHEICGGPDNLKVSTTLFRPLDSENEILPVIIFW
jgi:acetyl esterase